jgi:hypothetical protein
VQAHPAASAATAPPVTAFTPALTMSKKKGPKAFLAGAIAGAGDTCITMPLDTIKTQMQLNKAYQSSGLVSVGRTIVASDGVAGLYKGFPPFVFQASGKAAIRFMMYGVFTDAFDTAVPSAKESFPTVRSITCGVGAGMCEALFWTSPTERVKVMGQKMSGTGVKAPTFFDIVRTEGVGGLYVGAASTAARQATSVATRFTLVEKVKKGVAVSLGSDPEKPAAWVSFMAGGIGGAVSVVLNNPIDVIKSKIQGGYKGAARQATPTAAHRLPAWHARPSLLPPPSPATCALSALTRCGALVTHISGWSSRRVMSWHIRWHDAVCFGAGGRAGLRRIRSGPLRARPAPVPVPGVSARMRQPAVSRHHHRWPAS